MKLLVLFSACIIMNACGSVCAQKVPATQPSARLVFVEDFESGQLNKNIWTENVNGAGVYFEDRVDMSAVPQDQRELYARKIMYFVEHDARLIRKRHQVGVRESACYCFENLF